MKIRRAAPMLPTVAVAALLAGCASSKDQTAEPRDEKSYRTGSNLPQREGASSVKSISGEDVKRDMPTMPARAPGGGG